MCGFNTRKEAEEFQSSVGKEKLISERKAKHLIEFDSNNKHYKITTWSNSETKQFLELAQKEDTSNGLLYEITLATGLRNGEVCSLSWSDINFLDKTITINKCIIYMHDGSHLLKPNNYKRTIAIPDQIIEKLAIHKKRQEQLKVKIGEKYHNEYDLVFTNNSGAFINPSLIQRQFRNLIKKAGVKEITFHGLRHTHARLLIQNGVSIDMIASRLGHCDIKTTIDFYSHYLNSNNKNKTK